MQTLRAGTLLLEPLVAAHAECLFALLGDPELYRHLDSAPPPSVEHLRRVYAKWERRQSPDGRERWLNWVIWPNEGQPPAGYVQATVTGESSAWIAYVLGRASWGHGYATLAARCVMQHLQAHHGVTRFLAAVEQSNTRSIAVLERLGFIPANATEGAAHALTSTERLFMAQAL